MEEQEILFSNQMGITADSLHWTDPQILADQC